MAAIHQRSRMRRTTTPPAENSRSIGLSWRAAPKPEYPVTAAACLLIQPELVRVSNAVFCDLGPADRPARPGSKGSLNIRFVPAAHRCCGNRHPSYGGGL